MDPSSHSTPKWTERIKDHQHVEEDYHFMSYPPHMAVYGNRQFNESKYAFGNGTSATLTKLFFVYLGGLVYARKQMVPGYMYFTNRHYNWFGSMKYLLAGYVFGQVLSIFAFGNPYLVEDSIRRKLRSLTRVEYYARNPHNR